MIFSAFILARGVNRTKAFIINGVSAYERILYDIWNT